MNLDEMMNRKKKLLREEVEEEEGEWEDVKERYGSQGRYESGDQGQKFEQETECLIDDKDVIKTVGITSNLKNLLLNHMCVMFNNKFANPDYSAIHNFFNEIKRSFDSGLAGSNALEHDINKFNNNYSRYVTFVVNEKLQTMNSLINKFRFEYDDTRKEEIKYTIIQDVNKVLSQFMMINDKYYSLIHVDEKEFTHPALTELKNLTRDFSKKIYKIYDDDEREKYIQELENDFNNQSKIIEDLINDGKEFETNKIISKFDEYWSKITKSEKKDKTPELESLVKVYKKVREQLSLRYVDDPDGLQIAIDELDEDFSKAASTISTYVDDAKDEIDIVKQAIKSSKAIDAITSFKKEWLDQEKVLNKDEFRDKKELRKLFSKYMSETLSLPGIPASAWDTFKALTSYQSRFAGTRNVYGNFKDAVNDQELVKQVAHGVKPLTHIQSSRRELILNPEETDYLAFVLAPSRMGGGTIWYRPYRTVNSRPYSKEVLTPETEKESRGKARKPYDPHSNDRNLEIVRLYIWNNIANKSNSKIYNFINGLCLGYPRDFVIWYCESEYGQRDHRNPEKGFFNRLIDRAIYCIRGTVDGYGRPGTIEPDGMFSSIFKLLSPNGFNNFLNNIFRTSDPTGPYKDFVKASESFKPSSDPSKLEIDENEEEDEDVGFLKSIENIMDL